MHAFLRSAVVAILTWEAQLVLRRHKPKVIAITGSAGKTSTKDAIFCVLSDGRYVRKSQKSFNSELGVPLTILGLENAWGSAFKWAVNIVEGLITALFSKDYPQWLVLEVGADRPGDIRIIAKWLQPDIAVITSIPQIPVHVEYFNSPQSIAREKRYLAEYMKHDGKLIINGDDELTKTILEEFKSSAISFGFGGQNDFDADSDGIAYEDKKPVGMMFTARRGGIYEVPVKIFGALGKPRIYAALAALAAGEAAGVGIDDASKALEKWEPPPGRMRILPGIRNSVIIDDTYNSSPAAALAALDTLKAITHVKKKVAILGDMLELGRFSKEAHQQVGKKVAKSAHLLMTVGFRAKTIAGAALDAGMKEGVIRQYEQDEVARAAKELEEHILDEKTVVLIKGSQSMRMERAVHEIMAEPLRAPELLVRFDEEWLAR